MFTEPINNTMYNISKVASAVRKENGGGNSYTYTKVNNLLSGFKGNATKKEIQHLRKLLKAYATSVDNTLASLENQS